MGHLDHTLLCDYVQTRKIPMTPTQSKHTDMNYTIQCTDQNSGKTGCFIYDEQKYKETGKFFAVSEVFPDLHALYTWNHQNNPSKLVH